MTNQFLRYVYILEVDNRGKKSRYFGLKKIYYVGQTSNLLKRVIEHLTRKEGFIGKNFPDSIKRLVFVDYVYGTEYDSMAYEGKIKDYSRKKKEDLIKSDVNKLVSYVPFRNITLKKYKSNSEEIILIF
jgi:predicted GIY-YIG superfamily endonuclease